jgi:putative aldouronate transport system permease protein
MEMGKIIASKEFILPDRKIFGTKIKRDFRRNYAIYLLFVPVLAYYIIFHYAPIYGLVLAFKDYLPSKGIFGSAWVGLENFQRFFSSVYFGRTLRNTLLISIYELIFGFPAPILFALLLNEIRGTKFKRVIQTITYLPHFISTMVICGMLLDFCLKNGLFNDVIAFFGGTRTDLLMRQEMFRPIYIASGIWQGVGWGSIVYLAALTSIDQELYEAAYIDGATRFRQVIHITLPCLLPTITILFILKIGGLMSVGFEKVFLLYNPTTYEVADVISTFNYRKGLVEFDYSFSTAVGLFNSAINILLLVMANTISRKVNETSLW